MINYFLDYKYVDRLYTEYDRFMFATEEDRANYIKNPEKGYTVLRTYEDEECYCHAYYEGECACGNFK